MKKAITILMVIALIGLLGCGSKNSMPPELADAAEQAVTVSENYLSGEIDKETLYSRLNDITDYINSLDLSEDKEDAVNSYTPSEIGLTIRVDIGSIKSSAKDFKNPTFDNDSTYGAVQKLKEDMKRFK